MSIWSVPVCVRTYVRTLVYVSEWKKKYTWKSKWKYKVYESACMLIYIKPHLRHTHFTLFVNEISSPLSQFEITKDIKYHCGNIHNKLKPLPKTSIKKKHTHSTCTYMKWCPYIIHRKLARKQRKGAESEKELCSGATEQQKSKARLWNACKDYLNVSLSLWMHSFAASIVWLLFQRSIL